jgi:hypothetical protein
MVSLELFHPDPSLLFWWGVMERLFGSSVVLHPAQPLLSS